MKGGSASDFPRVKMQEQLASVLAAF